MSFLFEKCEMDPFVIACGSCLSPVRSQTEKTCSSCGHSTEDSLIKWRSMSGKDKRALRDGWTSTNHGRAVEAIVVAPERGLGAEKEHSAKREASKGIESLFGDEHAVKAKHLRAHGSDEVKKQVENLTRWKMKVALAAGEKLDLSVLEGAACPKAPACQGIILATYQVNKAHVYLCCSLNDPMRLRSSSDTPLCKWSFNKVGEADPSFAAVLLLRRQEELKNKENDV
jgi:hypothetical protein